VLAGLYPNRLRSIILDSAYPVRPPDPWFGTDWAAAWSGIDLSCGRSPSCSSLGGTATLRVHKVINDIRAKPITGKAPDGNGVLRPTTVDTSSLINIIDDAGFGPPIYRDLDAATRAWTDSKDSLPLRRLVAEQYTPAVYRPIDCSYGLYNDVTCSDYPLLYEMNATRAARDGQYTSALEEARQNRPALFAPFTVDEGIESQVYITPLDQCLPWRAPPKDLAPGSAGAPLPPSVHRRRPERRSRLQCNHAQAARLARPVISDKVIAGQLDPRYSLPFDGGKGGGNCTQMIGRAFSPRVARLGMLLRPMARSVKLRISSGFRVVRSEPGRGRREMCERTTRPSDVVPK
jgi:hypothetical protein